jgi:hypothetical protein
MKMMNIKVKTYCQKQCIAKSSALKTAPLTSVVLSMVSLLHCML